MTSNTVTKFLILYCSPFKSEPFRRFLIVRTCSPIRVPISSMLLNDKLASLKNVEKDHQSKTQNVF